MAKYREAGNKAWNTMNENSPVGFRAISNQQLIISLWRNPRLASWIPHERLTPRLVDAIAKQQPDSIRHIPKQFWTDTVIGMTVMRPELRSIMDPSLVTEKIIDDMCVFGYDCLKHLPHHKHPLPQSIKAVASDITYFLHINPDFYPKVIAYALDSKNSNLGGVSYIRDCYQPGLDESIRKFNQEAPMFDSKKTGSERQKALLAVVFYRLSQVDKDEFTALCVKNNAPEAMRRIHGNKAASAAFPRVGKRHWLAEDLCI